MVTEIPRRWSKWVTILRITFQHLGWMAHLKSKADLATHTNTTIAVLFSLLLSFSNWRVWLKHEWLFGVSFFHYDDVIMSAIASQITSLTIVYSVVYSDADQRKHQSSASLAFVRGIHRGPVNSPHKWPVTRKMFPFDDVIMYSGQEGTLGGCFDISAPLWG